MAERADAAAGEEGAWLVMSRREGIGDSQLAASPVAESSCTAAGESEGLSYEKEDCQADVATLSICVRYVLYANSDWPPCQFTTPLVYALGTQPRHGFLFLPSTAPGALQTRNINTKAHQ